MKKIFPFLMAFMLLSSFSFSQTDLTTAAPNTKTSESPLTNDFYLGYGGLSIFYFSGQLVTSFNLDYNVGTLSDPSSPGCIYIGYSRILNNVISTGFMFGYQDFQSTGTATKYESNSSFPATVDDKLLMGMAKITFSYVSKPIIHMYSGIGIGITMDFATEKTNGESSSDRKLFPAGQLTLMGLRFGRAFGGFIEFGVGTYGILNAGLSYRFAD
jgi:hypothetical protein